MKWKLKFYKCDKQKGKIFILGATAKKEEDKNILDQNMELLCKAKEWSLQAGLNSIKQIRYVK